MEGGLIVQIPLAAGNTLVLFLIIIYIFLTKIGALLAIRNFGPVASPDANQPIDRATMMEARPECGPPAVCLGTWALVKV